jgi:hypothetical protein
MDILRSLLLFGLGKNIKYIAAGGRVEIFLGIRAIIYIIRIARDVNCRMARKRVTNSRADNQTLKERGVYICPSPTDAFST